MATSNSETKSMQQHRFHHPKSRANDVESGCRPELAPASPTNRVKFLCSHGGKILPRPADGRLKYTGGETRVISVHRDVTFHELTKKVTSMFNGEMILKYQLMPEDLDVLVTVKSDEDVRHMIDECDQHEQLGAPRLRAFLFPANPIVIHPPPVSISCACSSPRTLSETTNTAATNCSTNPESTTCHGRPSSLTRTRSSPSLCHQVATAGPNLNQYHHHHHQQPPQPHHHHKQPPQPQPQPHHFHQQPYQPPKPPLDRHPHKASGPEHLGRVRPTGVSEYFRQQTDHTSHSHGTNRVGHVYYQTGSPYDAYCGDSPPSPDVRSSSPGNRSGQ